MACDVLNTQMYMKDASMACIINGLNLNKLHMRLPSIRKSNTK